MMIGSFWLKMKQCFKEIYWSILFFKQYHYFKILILSLRNDKFFKMIKENLKGHIISEN